MLSTYFHSAVRPAALSQNHLASPEQLRSLFENTVAKALHNHFLYHDKHAFSRDSKKLNLANLTSFIYAAPSSNLNIQIARFCGFNEEEMFANSSLSEARNKLSYKFFKDVYEDVLKGLEFLGYTGAKWNGRTLIGIDGCTLPLESFCKGEEDKVKTKNPNRPRAGAHIVTTMDLCTLLYTGVVIQRISKKDERGAALTLIPDLPEDSIVVMDRGFHCFGMEAAIKAMNKDFVIRLKKKDFYSLLKIKEADDIDDEIDMTKTLILTTHYKRQYKGDALHHQYAGKDRSFLDENGEYTYKIRLLKIKLKDGSYEYIATSLKEEEFSLEQIKEIYHARWKIEVGYLELKYEIGMLAVHARKMNGVYQEIYAALTLYNLSNCIVRYCEETMPEPKKQTRYVYRINRKYAFELCRDFFSYRFSSDEDVLVRMIQKRKTPVKPDRNFERHVLRKPKSNQHRLI